MVYIVQFLQVRDKLRLHLTAIGQSPLDILVPTYGALLALVSTQSHAAADVLGNTTIPSRFVNSAIDSLDLVPTLLGSNLREVCGRV